MNKILFHFLIYLLLLTTGIFTGVYLGETGTLKHFFNATENQQLKYDDTSTNEWPAPFHLVEIKNPLDDHLQKAYFLPTNSKKPQPLIVSLHSWSGDYTQKDTLAFLSKEKNINYIHPNFRGPNWTKNACCSDLALSDIDASIDYAMENARVDPSRIYVIGASGGGYATLCTFMKSKHDIKKYSAWVPISDLKAWYHESTIRNNKYAGNILDCTSSSDGKLNTKIAKEKSPVYWNTPLEKLNHASLNIYTGIYDGIQGSVPITQAINFYNKCLHDLGVADSSRYVSSREKLNLLENRKALGNFGKIGGRKICLQKAYKNIQLTVFTGNHEMLPEYAFYNLVE